MGRSEQKVLQYLDEAHASELALVRMLQSQILLTPRGRYRSALEAHLHQTRGHARRLEHRMQELGQGREPLQALLGFAESAIGQVVALGKAPLDLIRGAGGEEKVLKNAKDTCATEALEIATYTALERLARDVEDDATADLAALIRGEEEQMLERVLREIPRLTDAVVRAELQGHGSYEIAETGAADAIRHAGSTVSEGAEMVELQTRREARSVRNEALQASEPWPGYDELNVEEIRALLSEADEELLRKVESYERAHKGRSGVLEPAARESTHA
jgi:ferritin-like metal-binding protein YciE